MVAQAERQQPRFTSNRDHSANRSPVARPHVPRTPDASVAPEATTAPITPDEPEVTTRQRLPFLRWEKGKLMINTEQATRLQVWLLQRFGVLAGASAVSVAALHALSNLH